MTRRALISVVLLLLCWWLTRLPSLKSLPLHNDEGLHLTRAVEVWNLHPFWEIRDGKIVNHFVIAAFYPQNEPVFVGRIATLFVVMPGFAAGFALIRRRFSLSAAILAALFWIASSYLLFFERLAFSDAEAGALVVVALWAAERLARTGKVRDALLTGFWFGMAALFKFTAIPFALSVTVVVLLWATYPLVKRLRLLVIVGAVTVALFVVPVGYLVLRGDELFTIATGWIGGGGSGGSFAPAANIARLWNTLIGFSPFAAAMIVIGLAALVWIASVQDKRDGRDSSRPYDESTAGRVLLLALLIPFGVIVLFGREVLPRHFVVALPLALILAGTGFATLFNRLIPATAEAEPSAPKPEKPVGRTVGYALVLSVLVVPFVINLPTQLEQPEFQPLPDIERHQFIIDHSAGYALREAVLAFPQTIAEPDVPIIASMFPDSCRRANFYAVDGLDMICTDAPANDMITSVLNERGEVYVLVESAGLIGANIPALAESVGARAMWVDDYARPGERIDTPSVVLWRLEK